MKPRKGLNKAYLKVKPNRLAIEVLKHTLLCMEEEIKIVYLDDHLLFSNAMSQQCIYPYFPNAHLIQFTNGDRAHDYLENAIKGHDKNRSIYYRY